MKITAKKIKWLLSIPILSILLILKPAQAIMNPATNLRMSTDPYWSNVVLLVQPTGTTTAIYDYSNSNHILTTNGNVALSTTISDPWSGNRKVIRFDGTGDYLTIADSNDWYFGAGDVTIEAWVQFNALSASGRYAVFGHLTDGNDYYTLFVDNGTGNGAGFYLNQGGTYPFTGWEGTDRTSPTNSWVHFAYTRSGSNHKVFWNGVVIRSVTDSASNSNFTGQATIGALGSPITNFLNGYIGSLRITKGVARYTSAFTPPTSPFPTRETLCGGVRVGPHCWYYGNTSESCDDVCLNHGGYNSATLNYVGSAGTNASCKATMDALGVPGTTVTDRNDCVFGAQNNGCQYSTTLSQRQRCTNGGTTSGSSSSGGRRVCACTK